MNKTFIRILYESGHGVELINKNNAAKYYGDKPGFAEVVFIEQYFL